MLEIAFAALAGLVVGSFLNVCIYRIPKRESIVFPGSHCPHCQASVQWFDNIPIASYLVLGRRCRSCRAPIAVRYPLVEALTSCVFVVYYLTFGLSAALGVNILLAALTLALLFIDYDHQLLPDVLTLPGVALGLALSPWQSAEFVHRGTVEWTARLLGLFPAPVTLSVVNSVWGIVVGGAVLWIPLVLYLKIFGREGMGLGDVKMMAMVGAFTGWPTALLVVLWGSLLGSLVGGALMVARGKDRYLALPFGTFLGIATLLAVPWGPVFLDWYAGFF